MAHWNKADLEAAGILPNYKKQNGGTLVTCFRCGIKYPVKTCVEVGNDVYKCSGCINAARKV